MSREKAAKLLDDATTLLEQAASELAKFGANTYGHVKDAEITYRADCLTADARELASDVQDRDEEAKRFDDEQDHWEAIEYGGV